MEDVLFLLLRLGLGLSSFNEDCIPVLEALSIEDWTKIIDVSSRQGVAAIAFDGLQIVYKCAPGIDLVLDRREWKTLKYDWFGQQLSLEISNEHQISVMNELAHLWSDAGIRMLLFKGQANGLLYPNPSHRSTGDIDCFLMGKYEEGNRVAHEAGGKVDTHWYKHSQIRFKGESFENHQYFVHTRDGKKGKELNQKLCDFLLPEVEYASFPGSIVLLPPVMFNALFLTYHGLAHFLSEGLRLKQVTDWVMFLNKEQARIDWDTLNSLCEEFHLSRFLTVMNDIAVQKFGVRLSSAGISTENRFSEKTVKSILYDDDYVFSSGNSAWRNRFHLVRNMFKYRWKYKEIYGQGILKQLWFYVSGFVFHTDE